MNALIIHSIRKLLTSQGIASTERHHEPTRPSANSAKARGEELAIGAKALLLRTGEGFQLSVLPADRRLDSKAIRRHLGVRSVRFATSEDLMELIQLVPGSAPPFGPPILPFTLYANASIGMQPLKVACNEGSLTDSIILLAEDWQRVARLEMITIAAED